MSPEEIVAWCDKHLRPSIKLLRRSGTPWWCFAQGYAPQQGGRKFSEAVRMAVLAEREET
jgi:hypothetical protein